MVSLLDIDIRQLQALLVELEALDPKVKDRFDYVKQKLPNMSDNEIIEYIVTRDPALWAFVYLNWTARDYQIEMLRNGGSRKKIVLRLGRRLGKTECMCILILWHAWTQINKISDTQYDILIITPFETQVDLIFKRLHELIDNSPIFKGCVSRDVHHCIELSNGTTILGLTAGSKSGNGAANTRGKRADFLVLDEVDYMGGPEITNILNIRNENPDSIRLMAASTPCGKREQYYEWCTDATFRYHPPQEDIDNFRFTMYNTIHNPKGNGWCEIYAPSIVNKELLKINSDTGITYLEELKQELTEMRFAQEVMAEFGEELAGVYQKKFIDHAVHLGNIYNHKYTTDMTSEEYNAYMKRPRHTNIKILGVKIKPNNLELVA